MVLVLVLGLFECLFAEAGAGEFEVVEVVWDWLSEEVVYVEFGYVLWEHEAVSAHSGEEAEFWVDDVAWLNVVARPDCLETNTR